MSSLHSPQFLPVTPGGVATLVSFDSTGPHARIALDHTYLKAFSDRLKTGAPYSLRIKSERNSAVSFDGFSYQVRRVGVIAPVSGVTSAALK